MMIIVGYKNGFCVNETLKKHGDLKAAKNDMRNNGFFNMGIKYDDGELFYIGVAAGRITEFLDKFPDYSLITI